MRWVRTLVYYLTAFVGGALAWGTVYFLYKRYGDSMSISGSNNPLFEVANVIPVLQNALPQLIAAIILRVTMRRMAWTRWWQWLAVGSAISLAIVWVFGHIGIEIETRRLPLELQSLKLAVFFALMGPIMAVFMLPKWVPVAAVALTSLMLWVVQHGVGRRGGGA